MKIMRNSDIKFITYYDAGNMNHKGFPWGNL